MNCCDLLYFAKFTRCCEKQDILRSNIYCEILCVKYGRCKVHYNGGIFDLSTNDIILIPADTSYRFECENKCKFILIGFDKSSWNLDCKPTFYKGYDNTDTVKLIEMIENEFDGYKLHRKEMLNLILNVAVITLLRNSKACDSKKEIESDNFGYILNLMNSHSNNGLDINEISNISGLSYHRFRHKFKELVGISPQQYIIKQRLIFAKRLLETTSYNTASIAEACDFHSVPQFITCFSKQEGMTPVKYRKFYKNKNKDLNGIKNSL